MKEVLDFFLGRPPNTFEFLRGWLPDTWLPSDMIEYIIVMYFVVFQFPVLIWWILFKKYKDDSFYPRHDTPKGPIDYL